MTKEEVLKALKEARQHLLKALEGLSDEQLCMPGVNGEWSIKDLLFHLTMWEAELVKLLWQVGQGLTPTTIHFREVDVDQTNATWYEQGRSRPLARVWDDWVGVRQQTIRRFQELELSEEALNNPQHFPWLRGYPLWQWIAEDSFKHEAEHTAQVLAWRAEKGY